MRLVVGRSTTQPVQKECIRANCGDGDLLRLPHEKCAVESLGLSAASARGLRADCRLGLVVQNEYLKAHTVSHVIPSLRITKCCSEQK